MSFVFRSISSYNFVYFLHSPKIYYTILTVLTVPCNNFLILKLQCVFSISFNFSKKNIQNFFVSRLFHFGIYHIFIFHYLLSCVKLKKKFRITLFIFIFFKMFVKRWVIFLNFEKYFFFFLFLIVKLAKFNNFKNIYINFNFWF